MNRHSASPTQSPYPIVSPHCLSRPGVRPQTRWLIHPLRNRQHALRRVADSDVDEETLRDLNSQISLRHPELFCLPAVAPDDFEALVDGFLS